MDEVFGANFFLNEVVWAYGTYIGQTKNNFPRKHDTLLVYTKSSNYTFNMLRDNDLNSDANYKRWKKYFNNKNQVCGDNYPADDSKFSGYVKRFIKEHGRKPESASDVILEISGKVIDDVWYIQSVNPFADERIGYPTQKPEELLERIILASSNPGDCVFDCFMGSGTTQAVAMKLGRRFIGADINLGAIQTTTKRLISVADTIKGQAIKPQISTVSDANKNNDEYQLFASADGADVLSHEENTDVADYLSVNGNPAESIKYTGFEVYNVNKYDFFRNPVEARDLLIRALEIQRFSEGSVWDGELNGRMVKIMPVNRIATKADLEGLKSNLPYKVYEKRKEEHPNQPVERITIVCMGHEPDLRASFEQEEGDYKFDVEIVDILRDKSDLQLKREAEAEVVRDGNKLVIRSFYPMNLMQKLSLQKEYVEDWRQLVESIMIDWNYDGVVMQPSVTDVPGKKELVSGIYDIPENAGTIKVKITDLLSESLEKEV